MLGQKPQQPRSGTIGKPGTEVPGTRSEQTESALADGTGFVNASAPSHVPFSILRRDPSRRTPLTCAIRMHASGPRG